MAKIRVIQFQRVRQVADYETERVMVEAEVGPDETPEEVYADLRAWTLREMGIRERSKQT